MKVRQRNISESAVILPKDIDKCHRRAIVEDAQKKKIGITVFVWTISLSGRSRECLTLCFHPFFDACVVDIYILPRDKAIAHEANSTLARRALRKRIA